MSALFSILSALACAKLFAANIIVFFVVLLADIYLKRFVYSKREYKVCSIFATILAIIISSYANIHFYQSSYLFNMSNFIIIVGIIPFITHILLFLESKFNAIKTKEYALETKVFKDSKHSLLRYFLLILIAWLPVILSFLPGIFSYDAAGQLNQMVRANFSTHHPMVHTLFLGYSVGFGKIFFNSGRVGLSIHVLIQVIIFALSLAYIIDFLNKEKAPFMLKFISLLAFMFLPIMPIMAVTITKDILFASFYIISFIIIWLFIKSPKSFMKRKINTLTLVAFLSLSLLFRNNSLYAFMLFLPIVLIYLHKYWKYILKTVFYVSLVITSVNVLFMFRFDPESGSIREALSLPIQFFGRATYHNVLTEKEKNETQYFFWGDLDNYKEHISDPIKNTAYSKRLSRRKIGFLKLFLRLSFKYPNTLVDSFLLTNETYFNPFDKIPDDDIYRVLWEIRAVDDFNNFDFSFKNIDNPIGDLYYMLLETGEYNRFPVLKILFNISLYVYILLFSIMIFIIRKDYKKVIGVLPLLALFITALLGPVAILRYILPIVLATPITINMMIQKKKL